MSGIAGIAAPGAQARVERMLDRLRHRGRAGRRVIACPNATLGVVWGPAQPYSAGADGAAHVVGDALGTGRWARARLTGARLTLERDPLGIAPLYFGRTAEGDLCFASEVKALLELTREVFELPPGSRADGESLDRFYHLTPRMPRNGGASLLSDSLRGHLAAAIATSVAGCSDETGAWLSGGLDSSAVCALARPHVRTLHTFVAGVPGAPDLEYARAAAEHLDTVHHEVMVGTNDLLTALPAVIFHLESFDALLVRSSVTNFLAARRAAEYVPQVLSGEGGDELLAGYAYLSEVPPETLESELLDLTGRLHNTALQRVDRCAAAHGLVADVPFLSPAVVEFALRIPVEYKLRGGVEKWILRQALQGLLPGPLLGRRKAKFWEGAGVGEQLAEHAEHTISDAGFRAERGLPNGWTLNTKEELLYYRIFREQFGDLLELSWMGRTKGAPRAAA